MESKDKKTRTSITINPRILQEARKLASENKVSVSQLIEEALECHLAVDRAESNGVADGSVRNAL